MEDEEIKLNPDEIGNEEDDTDDFENIFDDEEEKTLDR